jgi:hypothetical protein
MPACAALWALLWCPLQASATGNSGAPDPELMLGPLPTHTTEQAAQAACGAGNVVWAERYAGYYYKPGEPRFGAAGPGAFACRKDAEQANYWDSDPMGAVMGYHGKSFPRPDPIGS